MTDRKCALYQRVSTDRQARVEEGGLDTQAARCRSFVEYQQGLNGDHSWEIVDEYREEGKSGKNTDRPEFQRMLADVRARRVNTVIVYKLDRISRSIADFLDLWNTFEEYGVEFISLNENFDTTTAIGRAMLKLTLVFAELEREQTAERTAAVMRHRAEQGLWNGGRVFGYDIDPNEKGVLKVNEEQAAIVVEDFFKKCVELGSASQVVRHLQERGIRRPVYQTRRGNVRGGNYFSKQTVINHLTSPVYLGKIEFKGEILEGRHEAIVDEALFTRVQNIIEENRCRRTNRFAQQGHVFLLQGLVRCGKCGSMMTPKWTGGRGGKRYHYYQCTRNSGSAGTECEASYAPAGPIEDFVVDRVVEWAEDPDLMAESVLKAGITRQRDRKSLDQQRHGLEMRLRDNQSSINRIVDAVQAGKGLDAFEARLRELEAERASMEMAQLELEFEIEGHDRDAISTDALTETYCDLRHVVEKLREAKQFHRMQELLPCFISSIDVYQNEDDPSSGRLDISLFEEEQRNRKRTNGIAQEKTLTESLLTSGCCERSERLPRLDSNQEPSG